MTNFPPDVIIELPRELAEMLLENCNSNLTFALSTIEKLESEEAIIKMVTLMEQFKAIKIATLKGLLPND